ncbi:YbjN domain-containing protein [uncultured Algimonas sp.]|uniref:YbjN domain-containing protein n=1 Tax=uncultured Algimonas sp. TaxID=1547920 RepID=UPI002627E91C|nr:YbjN domain-containing protein [uncultured Algimonas sp.]
MAFADDRCIRPAPTLKTSTVLRGNPIETFVRIATAETYAFERIGEHEVHISLTGLWCDHDLSLAWNAADEHLSLFILFDGKVPGGRSDSICRLLSLLNEQLSAGHFDYWQRNGTLVYRHAVSLRGGAKLSIDQALDLMSQALDAAERGYPAAQYVIWAGKSPEDALAEALVDIASHG